MINTPTFILYVFRELYYRNVELTHSQDNVNGAIKIIACLLQTDPWKMGVYSTSKGLMAGPVEIILADDSSIDCSTHSEGRTIVKNKFCQFVD